MNAPSARAFRRPGQDLWGTWRVAQHDFRALPELSPEHDAMLAAEEDGYLPLGLEMEVTGIAGGGIHPRSLPPFSEEPRAHEMVKIVLRPPYPQDSARSRLFRHRCDDAGRPPPEPIRLVAFVWWHLEPESHVRALWPRLPRIRYTLDFEDGSGSLCAYAAGGELRLLLHVPRHPGSTTHTDLAPVLVIADPIRARA